MPAVIIATIAFGLLVDQHWLPYGQYFVDAGAWIVLAALWRGSEPANRPALLACLLYATAGELFLSLVWGLYDYRLGNLPLFVPPGHVLLFYLGTRIAIRIPPRGEWGIALGMGPFIAWAAWTGQDTIGPLLYAMFLACMALSPSRKLYATMFVLALTMEFYGTWMGNWAWRAHVPWLGLAAANPPLAAGAFYCVLDLLVGATTRALRGRAPLAQSGNPIDTPSVASHQAATCNARSSSR
jgi:hypothetical protein